MPHRRRKKQQKAPKITKKVNLPKSKSKGKTEKFDPTRFRLVRRKS